MKPRQIDAVSSAVRKLLVALDEDPDREGLRDTPLRVARWWEEMFASRDGFAYTSFASTTTDQMVVVSGMRVWSVCEHHLLPFWCDVAVGYIARNRVLGLSKFGRIARACASKLQMQERLVQEIGTAVMDCACAPDVGVIARGEHLCMTMRGVRMPSVMTSSYLRGAFHDGTVRAEFIALATTEMRR